MNRRQVLGAGALTAIAGIRPAAAADVTIRQGYQTNIWGMPTYYLMKSGYLEKRGLKTEDFAVPSGNLTMQQMVARQVDMGTYAGPSFIIGHDTGGLVNYLKAWLDAKRDFKENPKKVSEVIYSFFTSKGYKMDQKTFETAMSRVQVDPGFPGDLVPYMTHHAEVLLQEKKISAMPDWKKAMRTDFMDKARKG
jgi:hypothetical protein